MILTDVTGRNIYLATISILLVGMLLRLSYVAVSPGVTKDEANTLLFAAGNNSAYDRMITSDQPPIMAIATAADWQKFVKATGKKGFEKVFGDSAVDVHPPFFYGLLHAWMRITESTLFGARLLNVLIDLLSGLVFMKVAEDLVGRRYGLLALLLYAVSPGLFGVCREVRSYALLGFCNVTAFWATWRLIQPSAKKCWWFVWGLANAMGIYTHYIFLLTFLTVNGFTAMIYLSERNYSRLKQHGTALFLVMIGLIPLGLLILNQVKVAQDIGWSGAWLVDKNLPAMLVWALLDTTLGAFRGFLFNMSKGATILVLTIILAVTAYGIINVHTDRGRWLVGSLLFSTWVVYGVLYFAGILPSHAIGAKYQVMAVPYFLLCLTCGLKNIRGSWQKAFVISILPLIMLSGSLRLAYVSLHDITAISPTSISRYVPRGSLLILDNTFSGMVLPVVLSMNPDQRLLVGRQSQLIRDDGLLRRLATEKCVVYMSSSAYNTDFTEQRVQDLLVKFQEIFESKTSASRIYPITNLGCAGCGKGFQVYVFQHRLENVKPFQAS